MSPHTKVRTCMQEALVRMREPWDSSVERQADRRHTGIESNTSTTVPLSLSAIGARALPILTFC
jgi:hypothetical protein